MKIKCSFTNPNTVGSRAALVRNLMAFKAQEERGIKKEYYIVFKKVQNHVTISWDVGKDIGLLLKHMVDKIP